MSDGAYNFEIVVVGAGPAGLAAACTAAESGRQVVLVDDTPWLGGQVWRGEQRRPSLPQAQQWITRFSRSGAVLLDQTNVVASPAPGTLMAEHPAGAREIRFKKLILATGARELLLPFPGWTLPGVMGPGGLQALAKNGWPVAGKRVVVSGTGPLLLAVADGLKKHGADIVCIAEQAPKRRLIGFGSELLRHPAKLWQGAQIKFRLRGIPFLTGTWPVRAEGGNQVHRATLTDGGNEQTYECDLLACGFHLVPNTELAQALGCAIAAGFVRVDEWQATSVENILCAGEPTGVGGADCALIEGQIAGYVAADRQVKARGLFGARRSWHRFRGALARAFALRPELTALADDNTIFCRCEDVPFSRVKQFPGWRNAKLQTRCGMGACQGRICGAAAAALSGTGRESVRPPVFPVRIASLLTVSTATNTIANTKPKP